MSYEIYISKNFQSQLKAYLKKDPKLKQKIRESLYAFQRERAISIGNQIYKLRIRGNNKGKSGGYRLYLYLIELEGEIVPIAIFSKNEKPDLSVKELSGHLKALRIELRLAI